LIVRRKGRDYHWHKGSLLQIAAWVFNELKCAAVFLPLMTFTPLSCLVLHCLHNVFFDLYTTYRSLIYFYVVLNGYFPFIFAFTKSECFKPLQ